MHLALKRIFFLLSLYSALPALAAERTSYTLSTVAGITPVNVSPEVSRVSISPLAHDNRRPSNLGSDIVSFKITNGEGSSILLWNVRVQVLSIVGGGTDGLGWETVEDDYPNGKSTYEAHDAGEIYVRSQKDSFWRVCLLYSKEAPAGTGPEKRSWNGNYEILSAQFTGQTIAAPPSRIIDLLPTPSQVQGSWTSNRVLVLVDTAARLEISDPGENPERWLAAAQRFMRDSSCEARAVVRYFFGPTNCLVYVTRWKSAGQVGQFLDRDNKAASAETAPSLGEKTYISQRDRMHNGIDFVRGRYLIQIEAPIGYGTNGIRSLAEAFDQNLINASGKN